MSMTDAVARQTRQARVILHEPVGGWSAAAYDQELVAYVASRGRAPQTVTMHPETAAALNVCDEFVAPVGATSAPLVVTSSDYARQTITLYY
jgi:hypothetical protein